MWNQTEKEMDNGSGTQWGASFDEGIWMNTMTANCSGYVKHQGKSVYVHSLTWEIGMVVDTETGKQLFHVLQPESPFNTRMRTFAVMPTLTMAVNALVEGVKDEMNWKPMGA